MNPLTQPSNKRTLTKAALAVLVAAMVGMWVWIYLFAPRDNPDRLSSAGFTATAEEICAKYQAEINNLPTGRDVTTVQARNAQIISGTSLTETMVNALKDATSNLVTDAKDLRLLNEWYRDWDAYLLDRSNHSAKLAELGEQASDNDMRFILTQRAEGGIYTRRIDGFANVNGMTSCHTPLDL